MKASSPFSGVGGLELGVIHPDHPDHHNPQPNTTMPKKYVWGVFTWDAASSEDLASLHSSKAKAIEQAIEHLGAGWTKTRASTEEGIIEWENKGGDAGLHIRKEEVH